MSNITTSTLSSFRNMGVAVREFVDSRFTVVSSNSASWDTAYTTVTANSATWASGGSSTSSTSASGTLASKDHDSIDVDLVPAADETYSLGTSAYKWKDLHISSNTIYIGNSRLSVDNSGRLSTPGGFAFGNTNTSELTSQIDSLSAQLEQANTTIVQLSAMIATLSGFHTDETTSTETSAFNISTRDTEANIIATNPTNPEGEVTVAYGTDTQDLYVWNGAAWYKFTDDAPFTNTYSLSFDGTNDYVTMSNPTSLNFGGSTTISFWVNYTNTSSSFNFLVDKSTSVNARQYSLYLRSQTTGTKTFSFYGHNNDGVAQALNSTATIAVNTWNHVALVCDSGVTDGTKLYINGVAETLGTFAITSNTSAPFQLGKRSDNSYLFEGLMDEVSVFNSALPASDIASIYNNGTPGDISSLNPVGWWRMGDDDSGTGTTITDQGSGGNNGTLTNGPTFSTTIPS